MKNNQKRFKFSKKNIFLGALGIIVILLVGWWMYGNFVPRPLGQESNVRYIGKEDYGCWYCDASPTTLYYYTTDMRPPMLVEYFKKASINAQETEKLQAVDSAADPNGFFMLRSPGNSAFYVEYIKKDVVHMKKIGLKDPVKKYVFRIRAENYQAAKESL